MGKLIVKKSYMLKLHFVCQSKRFSSLPPDQKSSNWRPLLKFYSPKCFSTRHGDRNGRSLERCGGNGHSHISLHKTCCLLAVLTRVYSQ